MRYLLDTQLLIWIAGLSRRLSPTMLAILDDPDNALLFSAASIWEIAFKFGLGQNHFLIDPRVLHRRLLDNGYAELTVTSLHAATIDSLPPIHKDPFDRLLLAQAISEGVILLTTDSQLARYPGPVRQV